MNNRAQPELLPPRAEMERAFLRKDASYDGIFFVAVRTTGIFCRPSCPSKPQLRNTEFFPSVRACLDAGYRPCKRCAPQSGPGQPPEWIAQLMRRVEASPETPVRGSEMAALGVTPERVRRWFLGNYGMSFASWCRSQRLAGAYNRLRHGHDLDAVALESGFESHSGFRDAFAKVFGAAPGKARRAGARVVIRLVDSPVGHLLLGTTESGICCLQFVEGRWIQRSLQELHRQFGCGVVSGTHAHLVQLERELGEYFAGTRRAFEVPLDPHGTAFQEQVWAELGRIPYGETISYEELARRIARPTAQRAVAQANGQNRIAVLIPCHRVVGKDGTLTGYGGGLWRKRLLLELERTGALPGSRWESP